MATAWHGRDSTSEASDPDRRPIYQTETPRTRSYSGSSNFSRRARYDQQDGRRSSTQSQRVSTSSGRATALPSGHPDSDIPPLPTSSERYDGVVFNRQSRDGGSAQRQRLYLSDDDGTDVEPLRERKQSFPSVREPSRGGNPPLLPFSYQRKDNIMDRLPAQPVVPFTDSADQDLQPLKSREEFLPESYNDRPSEDRKVEDDSHDLRPLKSRDGYLPTSYNDRAVQDRGTVRQSVNLSTKDSGGKSTSTSVAWSTKLYTVSYLIFFSFLGTLARLGLQWLTFYPGAPLTTPVLWANMAGSVIIGFLAEDQQLFSRHWLVSYHYASEKRSSAQFPNLDNAEKSRRKKTLPLYIGLATGFCGSFTSFSSFARDIFLALSNDLPAPLNHAASAGLVTSSAATLTRNGGYSFQAILAITFYTLALSLGGLLFGAHLTAGLQPYLRPLHIKTSRILDPVMVFIAFGCWIGAILLAIFPPDRPSGPASRGTWDNEVWRGEVLFALVFAPIGCLTRYYASLWLNPISAKFPLGTFAVNIFGTAIEAMCYDLQRVGIGSLSLIGGGRVGCQVLQGIMDGFCGCLTTVSTWVAEINSLRKKYGYWYAIVTILVALALDVVIMGPVRWSVGWAEPVCNTGYPSKLYG